MDSAVTAAIHAAYDAATGGGAWQDVGNRLKHLVGARTASLWVGDPAAGRIQILYAESIPEEAERDYSRHFYALDPWVKGFGQRAAHAPAGAAPDVAVTAELVDEAAYRRGEFYQEFARHLGLYHVVGGVYPVGSEGIMPLGLHRPEGAEPFGEAERQIVRMIVPHLHHAVRINLRLGADLPASDPAMGAAALDAFPVGAVILDGAMRVIHANAAAQALARSGGALRFRAAGPSPSHLYLEALARADHQRLARLCRAVAAQASLGGGMSLACADDAASPIAVVVTPLAARLLPPRWGGAAPRGMVPGYALVLASDLSRAPRLPPRLLAEVFGLTLAEAEVAAALCGGLTAEAVARARGVGPATIRTQVRVILEKTGAPSLRQLERMLALLPGA
jgi:DNA-binding CsgD family transcriptional regulator